MVKTITLRGKKVLVIDKFRIVDSEHSIFPDRNTFLFCSLFNIKSQHIGNIAYITSTIPNGIPEEDREVYINGSTEDGEYFSIHGYILHGRIISLTCGDNILVTKSHLIKIRALIFSVLKEDDSWE